MKRRKSRRTKRRAPAQGQDRAALKVPGDEIAITREHDEELDIALRDAFDAARRKLEDHVRQQRP